MPLEHEYVREQVAWPAPVPLPLGMPPVVPFETFLLPSRLQPWAADVVERMCCPGDFVGVALMAALAGVIGRKVGIRPKAADDWTVVSNMWALLIGRPGILKSPAMEEGLRPLKRLAARAIDEHKEVLADHRRAALVEKMKRDAINKAAQKKLMKDPTAAVTIAEEGDDEAPPLHRYMSNDPSAAALAEILRHNPNGLMVYRDELVSLLRHLDGEENAEARAFYLTGWNGDSSYTADRIVRGMNLHVEAVCLTLLGSTQPGRIAEYVARAVRGGAGDDGLIQRFGLTVWPDVGGEWRNVDRAPNDDALREAHAVFDHLDHLDWRALGARRDIGYDGDEVGIPYLRCDPAAHEVFVEWRTELENLLRSGTLHPAVESHLAKYRKLVPGLALIFHLASGSTGPITVDAMVTALAWDKYLRSHAGRLYTVATNATAVAARAIMGRLRKGDLAQPFSSRDVWRPCWAGLADRQTVNDALTLLVDFNYVRRDEVETGGRTATIYLANPLALARGDEISG